MGWDGVMKTCRGYGKRLISSYRYFVSSTTLTFDYALRDFPLAIVNAVRTIVPKNRANRAVIDEASRRHWVFGVIAWSWDDIPRGWC